MSSPPVPHRVADQRAPAAASSGVPQLITAVNAAGGGRDRTKYLDRLVASADGLAAASASTAQTLPVVRELAPLLPAGALRRGGLYLVSGSSSLVWTIIGGAAAAGGWCAVVGMPGIAHASAVAPEYGIDLTRVAFVPEPGPQWATVVAALLDGLELVIVAPPEDVADSTARQLRGRARASGSVLIWARTWPDPPRHVPQVDLALTVAGQRTIGLGMGHGRIRRREITVRAHGRGAAALVREVTVEVPPPSLHPDAGRPPVGQIQGDAPTQRRHQRAATAPAAVPIRPDSTAPSPWDLRDGHLVGLPSERAAS